MVGVQWFSKLLEVFVSQEIDARRLIHQYFLIAIMLGYNNSLLLSWRPIKPSINQGAENGWFKLLINSNNFELFDDHPYFDYYAFFK